MIQKIFIWFCVINLIDGQNTQPQTFGSQQPFVFDLPPLQLQPLQLRLNPSSSSLFLINKNESIPIDTFPSQTVPQNNLIPLSKPQSTQTPVPQSNPNINTIPSQPVPQQTFNFLPLAFQQLFSVPQTQSSQRPVPQQRSAITQQSAQPSAPQTTQSVDQNNTPNDSAVNNQIPTIESVLRDMSLYVPIQLPTNALIFQQAFPFQTIPSQSIQTQVSNNNNDNIHILPPITLPAINLPPNEMPINMIAVDVINSNSESQTDVNSVAPTPAQPKQQITPTLPPLQLQQQSFQVITATQPPVLSQPTVPKTQFQVKPLSFRSLPFQSAPNIGLPLKRDSLPKSQSLSSFTQKAVPSVETNPKKNVLKNRFLIQSHSESTAPSASGLPSLSLNPNPKATQQPIQTSIRRTIAKPSTQTQTFNREILQKFVTSLQFKKPLTPPKTDPKPIDNNIIVLQESGIGSSAKQELNPQPIASDKDLSVSSVESDELEFGRRLSTRNIPTFSSYFQKEFQT